MSLSPLPLGYCTNVHPATTTAEVNFGLHQFSGPVSRKLGQPMAAGLWLAKTVIDELQANPTSLAQLQQTLEAEHLVCYSLNAFPYGNFHGSRVKEQVYLPDWSAASRVEYTLACAEVLAQLLPPHISEGSISTVPLGFANTTYAPAAIPQAVTFAAAIPNVLEVARRLKELESRTGKSIRLAIEPEPCCVLETTPQAIEFFDLLFNSAADQGVLETTRQTIGLCYDVCHQAVEFEEISPSIAALDQRGIRINKLHITCALHLDHPADNPAARQYLASFAEPRYLHQTIARTATANGSDITLGASPRVIRHVDLSHDFAMNPPQTFLEADAWRIHFHVPVNKEHVGPLSTTRPQLEEAIAAVATLSYAPHLEVETYTWPVLPDSAPPSSGKSDLVAGLTAEMKSTQLLLSSRTCLESSTQSPN
jgi:sugar phosphate isomerase/epimerase